MDCDTAKLEETILALLGVFEFENGRRSARWSTTRPWPTCRSGCRPAWRSWTSKATRTNSRTGASSTGPGSACERDHCGFCLEDDKAIVDRQHPEPGGPKRLLLGSRGGRPSLFRFVRHLPVRCHGAAHGADLRAGVGQTSGEETAARATVVRSCGSMAIVAQCRRRRWPDHELAADSCRRFACQ